MADHVTTTQIKVLCRHLDPESIAGLMIDLVELMPEDHHGIGLEDVMYDVSKAVDALYDRVVKCEDLARESYDPEASRADRRYEELRDDEDR